MTQEQFVDEVAKLVQAVALANTPQKAALATKTPAPAACPPVAAKPSPAPKYLATVYVVTSTNLSRDHKWLDVRLETGHGRKCTLRFDWRDIRDPRANSQWCLAFASLMDSAELKELYNSDELVGCRIELAIGQGVENTTLAKPEGILNALRWWPT